MLKKAKEYLEAKPEIAEELSAAERRKRAQLKSKPVYKYVALIISLFGVVAAAYGIHSLLTHSGNYGIYFALFGFAAIFLFSSYNMMPTARNNNSAIMKRAEKAEAAMADYLKPYPHGTFPVPGQYAHPCRPQADDGRRGGGPCRHRARGAGSREEPPAGGQR